MARRLPAAIVEARLAPLLGPHTARNAVRTFCQLRLGVSPEALPLADAPTLLAALRPTLRTLLGAAAAELLLEEMAWELS